MKLESKKKKLNIFLIFNFLITAYYLLLKTPIYAATTNIREKAEPVFEIKDIGVFLKNILGISLTIAAILAFGYLIWGAIEWMTSEGDQEKLKKAKGKITQAIIGLAIMALVWLIWLLTIYFLGIGVVNEGQVDLSLPEY